MPSPGSEVRAEAPIYTKVDSRHAKAMALFQTGRYIMRTGILQYMSMRMAYLC